MRRRYLVRILTALILAFGAIQLVPYGRDHLNPAKGVEPNWDSATTRALAQRACFDCHSNETIWPGYANIAPASWLVQRDVDEGRETLNFSEWTRPQEEAGEAAESVKEGEMPPAMYLWMHDGARLAPSERDQLIDGLARTMSRQASERRLR